MVKLSIIFLAVLTAGCASTLNTSESEREMEREIVLSTSHPQNDFIKARLVDIAKDGTTTIQVLPSGPILSTQVGGYYVSKEYGQRGLQLISASAEKHEVRFVARWAE